MDNKKVLIEVKNLSKHFKVGRGKVLKAVDNVTFNIYKGETFGVVGESGCGKTTCGRTVLGMYKPTSGSVHYDGRDTSKFNSKEAFHFKKDAQYIFQDPYASLDPRMTIGDIIAEGMDVHIKMTDKERTDRINQLLNIVGLNKEHGARFPHELSGGQRQRVGIARSLAVEPEFIVCDEPISALDVSIQAQIVNLMNKLQKEMGLTYMFISHDLSMVKHISDRIAVMYLGSIVELAKSEKIYEDSLHPYTKALISAIPVPDPQVGKTNKRIKLEGEVPSPIDVPPGCKFAGRCPYVMDVCHQILPELREIEEDHFVACHLYDNPDNIDIMDKEFKSYEDHAPIEVTATDVENSERPATASKQAAATDSTQERKYVLEDEKIVLPKDQALEESREQINKDAKMVDTRVEYVGQVKTPENKKDKID